MGTDALNLGLAFVHGGNSWFFESLGHNDEFCSDSLTSFEYSGRVSSIPTPVQVLQLFSLYVPIATSLQEAMYIISKRSVLESFTAPTEWVSFLNRYSPGILVEKEMEKLSVDKTLVINRKGKSDGGSSETVVLLEGRGLCSLPSAGHIKMIATKSHHSTVQAHVSLGSSW
jgi:hypothetical protein